MDKDERAIKLCCFEFKWKHVTKSRTWILPENEPNSVSKIILDEETNKDDRDEVGGGSRKLYEDSEIQVHNWMLTIEFTSNKNLAIRWLQSFKEKDVQLISVEWSKFQSLMNLLIGE